MTDARTLLKDDSFSRKLKPCKEVLEYLCKEALDNIGNKKKKLTPTAIARELYKSKYEELEKQLKIAEPQKEKDPDAYTKIKKDVAQKKKHPVQTIWHKLKILSDLDLISKNTYLKKEIDTRNAF